MAETNKPITPERSEQLRQAGFSIDTSGRPLHPWIAERDMEFPEQTTLWQWGPNAAADAIVFNSTAPEVLLTQRQSGRWANAGGFIDASDTSDAHAAAREAHEETGITVDPAEARPVSKDVVADSRASKYSWITSAAFFWRTAIRLNQLAAGDDAKDLRLFNLADVHDMPLSGSHNFMIEQAVNTYGTPIEKLHFYRNSLTAHTAPGGHMGYERYVAVLPTNEHVFVKQTAPQLYTATARAERSVTYLKSEYAAYQHLQSNAYQHIPTDVGYYEGTLAMDAMTPQDGWHWHCPAEHSERYITDTLAALQQLQAVPDLPATPGIKPSIVSFYAEGWGAYTAESKQKQIAKLHDYAVVTKNDDFSDTAYKLVDALDDLYTQAAAITYDQPMVLCHHDFRQSNFAWHPRHGVKIVDWSWAGRGLPGSDATTFLVDLHKHGVDVHKHIAAINPAHLLTMLGFWLMHGAWEGGQGDVRFQQIHSAVAAYDLLSLLK